jgi:hypothetical protein
MKNDDKSLDKEKLEQFVSAVEDNTNEALEDSLLDEDAKGENFNVNYTDIVQNTKKDRISKLPWLIAIFLILIIAITFGMMFFQNNPKTIFTQKVDDLFNYVMDNINDNVYDITDGNIKLNYSIKTNDESNSLYSELSKITFDTDYIVDNANDLAYLNIKTKYDGQDYLKIDFYEDKNNIYIYPKDIYSKYIKVSNTKYHSINSQEIKTLLKGFNQAFDKVIAAEKITGSKQSIDINGKTVKAYASKFVVDKNNRDRVSKTFIDTLKSNDEVISILAKMKNTTKANINQALDKYLTKIQKALKKANKVELIIYTNRTTGEFLKFDLNSNDSSSSFVKENKNQYSYNTLDNSDKTNTSVNVNFDVNSSKTKYHVVLTSKETKDNNVLYDGSFDLKFTNKKANSFPKVDVSEASDWDNMSETDKLDIYTKLFSKSPMDKILSNNLIK